MIPILHLETIGKGPPLVMLHGWGWHSGIWQSLIPELSRHYQLFLIDLPGFGKSTLGPADYTINTVASSLFTVVPNEAAWLGWSLGGMIAWWIAIHYPEKINYLITVASSPRFVQDDTWPGVPLSILDKFSDSLLLDYEKALLDFLTLQTRNHFPVESHKITTHKPELNALKGGLQLLHELDLRPHLKKITCKSLHIFGSLDTLVPVKVVTQLQPLLSSTSRCEVIKRSGHIPFLSHPRDFLDLL